MKEPFDVSVMRSGGHIHHVTRQHLIMWLLVINAAQSEDGGKNDTMMGRAVTSFTLPPTPHTQTHKHSLLCSPGESETRCSDVSPCDFISSVMDICPRFGFKDVLLAC